MKPIEPYSFKPLLSTIGWTLLLVGFFGGGLVAVIWALR